MPFWILNGRTPVPADSMREFAEFMNDPTKRRVLETRIQDVKVSTIFLGLDHGFGGTPQLFESMVFDERRKPTGGRLSGNCRRYATWNDAEWGHRELVDQVKRQLAKHGELKPVVEDTKPAAPTAWERLLDDND